MPEVKQMIKTAQLMALILVANVAVTLAQIKVSASELPNDMPVVYVDPQQAFGAEGTIFTVSVKIFNLTDSFYPTDSEWETGEPLPPPGTLFNYSLGNMYGFDIVFSWDPAVLEYVDRSVMTPVEEFPEGVLHAPIVEMQDEVDSLAGNYSLSQSSWPPVISFNCPNDNATIFTITFRVKEERTSSLRLESVELMLDPILAIQQGVPDIIPHRTVDGEFSRVRTTRIVSMNVGALVGTQWHNPLIAGEDAIVSVFVFNEGEIANFYNLSLYDGDTLLVWWKGESLGRHKSRVHDYTLKTNLLGRGIHRVTAELSVLHYETIIVDLFTGNFTLIYGPLLSIIKTPIEIEQNETMTLSAESSFHQDPSSFISTYTWLLYEPEAEIPAYEFKGVTVTHRFSKNGTWTAVLTVEDNWGITLDPLRTATAPYRKEIEVNVGLVSIPDPILTQEQVTAIIVFILMAIATIVGYTFGKWRR
ncbi:hypothetical protein KAU87_03415 [Candidatus Bathyarchaeota archaeon]|nr:hypothetical protein [Candidatus Bathyarchaeota archaeon]